MEEDDNKVMREKNGRIDEINIRCARMQKEREISSLNTQRWSKIRNELDNGTLIIQDQRRASRR